MDPGPNPANLRIFLISWIFGIPIFRTLLEIDPPRPLRANHYVEKDPIWILSMLGFRHKLSKVFVFTNHIQLFHENPVSSVRPSEASSGRFLCFHPDSGGLLDFRYRILVVNIVLWFFSSGVFFIYWTLYV